MGTLSIDPSILALIANHTAVGGLVMQKQQEQQEEEDAGRAPTGTISDSDPVGAMHFTIAVVLVYGVGVIGLLGISARRNRRLELMDREVNKYIQTLTHRPHGRKAKQRGSILKLLSPLSSSSRILDKDPNPNPCHGSKPFIKSLSWTDSGRLSAMASGRRSSSGDVERSKRDFKSLLSRIVESKSEEALPSASQSEPGAVSLVSPSSHGALSDYEKDLEMGEESERLELEDEEICGSSVTTKEVENEMVEVTLTTPKVEIRPCVASVTMEDELESSNAGNE